ncbi:MAG: DUF2264 domain-containing protein [Acetobacterales bacterium]
MRLIRKAGRGVAVLGGLVRHSPALIRHHRFPQSAERLLREFHAASPSPAAYADLLRYFALGWRAYRTDAGSGARYPGLPSWSGGKADALEGFARLMPMFGAWCASGREPDVVLPDGGRLALPEEFERGLVAGTDPASPGYWGPMPGRSNQRIVEAADIALALWLFRDSVWEGLPAGRREAVADWLSQLAGKPGLDNNWQLFFVLVDRVLSALGYPGRIPDARARHARIREFHLGDGWFKDGPGGRVDYYSAWGFHHALHWIDRIDPAWDPVFIRWCERQFLSTYKYVFAADGGLPILGRSIPYRMAAPAPLVLGHRRQPDIVSAGEARRALDAVWSHFISRGAVRRGGVTQGYYGSDPRLLDPYSGPASALWSLRSLVAAFRLPPDSPFWAGAGGSLPVEEGDFSVMAAGGRWRILGERATGATAVEILDNSPGAAPELAPVTRLQVLRRIAEGQSGAPGNTDAKYGRRFYRSDRPFCA